MTEKLPSSQKAIGFLKKSGCSQKVILHCKAVSKLAVKFAKSVKKNGFEVDINLVKVGALLHDIGRSKTHDIDHAIIGVEISKSLNLANSIVSVIENHIGGITSDEAEKFGWPIKDYFPSTLEEKIVAYADKLIEGLRVVPIEKTIEKLSKELGENHPALNRLMSLHEELSPLIGDLNVDNNLV